MPAFVGAMQEPQHRNGEVQSLRLSREKWEVASVVSLANGENSAANAREKLDVEDILKYPGRIQRLFYNILQLSNTRQRCGCAHRRNPGL